MYKGQHLYRLISISILITFALPPAHAQKIQPGIGQSISSDSSWLSETTSIPSKVGSKDFFESGHRLPVFRLVSLETEGAIRHGTARIGTTQTDPSSSRVVSPQSLQLRSPNQAFQVSQQDFATTRALATSMAPSVIPHQQNVLQAPSVQNYLQQRSGDLNGIQYQLETTDPFFTVPPLFSRSAAQTHDGQQMLMPYFARFRSGQVAMNSQPSGPPAWFRPWWNQQVVKPIGAMQKGMSVSINALISRSLIYSPHIQVAATEPHIRQTVMFEESAGFDWTTFVESKFTDTNDPIGNELTTGNNANRFTQHEWYARGGLRRKMRKGAEVELTQRLGYLNNNSRFLIPPNQGNSRIELNFRQPLLRGRGKFVNESLIVLANIDSNSANDQFMEELQSHLSEVAITYWELVRARAKLLQRKKLLYEAEQILTTLTGRATVDALDRQIYRAKAAVAKRRAELARTATSIKNAESRLRLLVNAPELVSSRQMEFLPIELPQINHSNIDLGSAVTTALANRPDISRAIRDYRTSVIKNGVAKNDLAPKLDLLLGTYVAGLEGNSDAINSWVNQFRDGRPGYHVGLEFEVPIRNRAARARQQRRQWELHRATHRFKAVVESSMTEVEIAVREVNTAAKELSGRYHAMIAAGNESRFLKDRWKTLANPDDSVTLLLEDLLDSQERLADEEAAFAKAQYDYSVASIRLKKAMGILFQVHR